MPIKKKPSKEIKKLPVQSKEKKKKSKELYWILGVMASLIIIFFLAQSFFQSFNEFEYRGLTITKQKFGELPIYYYYYYFNNKEGKLIKFNLYLRHDPRKMEIPVEGAIDFKQGLNPYITFGPGLDKCDYTGVAISQLGSFLSANFGSVGAATFDLSALNQSELRYMTCETNPNDIVIVLAEGEQTKITRQDNCYTITAANCEILQAVERFQIEAILEGKANTFQKVAKVEPA